MADSVIDHNVTPSPRATPCLMVGASAIVNNPIDLTLLNANADPLSSSSPIATEKDNALCICAGKHFALSHNHPLPFPQSQEIIALGNRSA